MNRIGKKRRLTAVSHTVHTRIKCGKWRHSPSSPTQKKDMHLGRPCRVRWGLKGRWPKYPPRPERHKNESKLIPPLLLTLEKWSGGGEKHQSFSLSLFGHAIIMTCVKGEENEGRSSCYTFSLAALITRKACRVSESHNTVVASIACPFLSREKIFLTGKVM